MMNKASHILFLIPLLLSTFVANAFYQLTDNGKSYGIVIGIDDYEGDTWNDLTSTVTDGLEIKEVLKEKYGFDQVQMLFNKNATRTNILNQLENLSKTLKEEDNLLIYFSGHGLQLGDEGYWVPSDSKGKDVAENIPNGLIMSVLRSSKARHILVLADACFNSMVFKSSVLSYPKNAQEEVYYNKVNSLMSRQVITGQNMKPHFDKKSNKSYFAKHVLNTLKNNKKPYLDTKEFFNFFNITYSKDVGKQASLTHIQNTGHEGGQFIFCIDKEEGALVDATPEFNAEGSTTKLGEPKKTSYKGLISKMKIFFEETAKNIEQENISKDITVKVKEEVNNNNKITSTKKKTIRDLEGTSPKKTIVSDSGIIPEEPVGMESEVVISKPAVEKAEQPIAKKEVKPAVEKAEQPIAKKEVKPAVEKAEQPIAKKEVKPTVEKAEQPIATEPKPTEKPKSKEFNDETIPLGKCGIGVAINEGAKVKFTNAGTLHAFVNNPKGVSYAWYRGQLLMGNAQDLTVSESDVYTIVVTNEKDCSEEAKIEVTVKKPPLQVSIAEGRFIEFENYGILTAQCNKTADNIRYEWWKDNRVIGTSRRLKVVREGVYHVTARTEQDEEAMSKIIGVRVTKTKGTYKVKNGDDLQRIAKKEYGDPDKWLLIYDANKDNMSDGEMLVVGKELVIPPDDEVKLASKFPIKLVTMQGFPPFSDQRMYKDGMLTHIVAQVFDDMNQDVDLEHWTWYQAYSGTEKGIFAGGYPFMKNKKLEEKFLFSDPLYKILTVWFVRTDSKIKYDQPTDLKGLVVGRPKGYPNADIQELIDNELITVKPFDSIEDCFKMLHKGKVDMVAVPQMTGLGVIRELKGVNALDFKILPKAIEANTIHLMVSKDYKGAQAVIYKFNKILKSMERKGLLKSIQDLHIDLYQVLDEDQN